MPNRYNDSITQKNGDSLPLLDAFFANDVVSSMILACATSMKLHLAGNRNEIGIYWFWPHQTRYFHEEVEPSKKNHSPKIWKNEGAHCKPNILKSISKLYWLHFKFFFSMLHKLKVLDSNNNENMLKNCILYFFSLITDFGTKVPSINYINRKYY